MDSSFLQSAGFLEAKTNIPVLRSGFISRARLNNLLNDTNKNIYLIHAPAGYGKTSLLIDYKNINSIKTAWLSIDSSDNNLNSFFNNLCYSINKAEQGLLSDVLDLWSSENKLSKRSMLDIILNKLTLIEKELNIVLDDFHYINSQEIYELIEQLINWLPSNIKLFFLSRRRLNFRNIPKLKLREQILFVDSNDLRFSVDEVRDLFSINGIKGLSREEERILTSKSEGWVAGLQFVTISNFSNKNISRLINDFDKSNKNIKDYFFLEVLENIDDDLKLFMRQTAFLEIFCSDLCDKILGIKNSEEIIERLIKNNLFVIEVKDGCYRYHNLMKNMLLETYTKSMNGSILKLQKKAASWFVENRHYEEALTMYKNIGDYNSILKILNEKSSILIFKSELVKLCNWVELLSIDIVLENPVLTMDYIWALIGTGELKKLDNVIDKSSSKSIVHNGNTTKTIDCFSEGELLAIKAVRAHFLNDINSSIKFSNKALPLLLKEDRSNAIKSVVLFHLGKSYLIVGRHVDAIKTFTNCIENSKKNGFWTTLLMSYSHIGMINILQAKLTKANYTFSQIIKEKGQLSNISFPTYCFAYLGLGIVAIEENRLDQGLKYLNECIRLNNILGNEEIYVVAHFQLCRIFLLQQQINNYEIANSKLYDIGLQSQQERVKNFAKIYIAMLEIGTGHYVLLDEIIDDLKAFKLNNEVLLYYMKEQVLANYYFSINNMIKAKNIISNLIDSIEINEQGFIYMSSLLLMSKISLKLEERNEALITLKKAIEIGAQGNIIRCFLDEEQNLSDLIFELKESEDLIELEKDFIALIISNFKNSMEKKRAIVFPNSYLIDPLSKRELDVIELLAKGMKNREIANALFISVGTVKSHIINIFSKLDVRNRTEAIIKAKDLSLVEY